MSCGCTASGLDSVDIRGSCVCMRRLNRYPGGMHTVLGWCMWLSVGEVREAYCTWLVGVATYKVRSTGVGRMDRHPCEGRILSLVYILIFDSQKNESQYAMN